MTSAKTLGLTPVATHEVVEALAALLWGPDEAPTPFREFVEGGGGRLHTHRVPARAADPADGREPAAAPFWALLWERRPNGDGPEEGYGGLVPVRVQLQVNVDPDGRPAPDRELGHAHALAYDLLHEADLGTVTAGSDAFAAAGLVLRDRPPTPAADDREGRRFSSALFAVPVHPVPTP